MHGLSDPVYDVRMNFLRKILVLICAPSRRSVMALADLVEPIR